MEDWHPRPASFYASGAGPLLDIGPYYVTQLVNLLGPVVEVVALGSRPRHVREATSPGDEGERVPVEVPTTVNGALRFENGANVAIALSWDVPRHSRPPMELYGEAGTIIAPDPNGFDGAYTVLIGDEPPEIVAAGDAGRDPPGPAVIRAALRQLGQGSVRARAAP